MSNFKGFSLETAGAAVCVGFLLLMAAGAMAAWPAQIAQAIVEHQSSFKLFACSVASLGILLGFLGGTVLFAQMSEEAREHKAHMAARAAALEDRRKRLALHQQARGSRNLVRNH